MESVFSDKTMQQTFDTEGVVTMPLLKAEELRELISFYESHSQGIGQGVFHSTMFINNADYRRLMDEKIRSILGSRLTELFKNWRLLFANFIVKESSPQSKVDIHQDWNFTAPDCFSINIWIPLVDINENTGLFYALKGSHTTFKNIRYTPYPEGAYSDLGEWIVKNSTPFSQAAGDAIIYHGSIVHYSAANISGSKRLAIGLVMVPDHAVTLHYYRPSAANKVLNTYETNEEFYYKFNFRHQPEGVKKIGELSEYPELPTLNELMLTLAL